MRGKRKRIKDIFSKKISLVVLVTLVISSILIPNIISRAEENKTVNRVLKVLEIQPGNDFIFDDYKGDDIEFTCLDMPTFISMVDELNGKYDVIYIGNKNKKLSDGWDTGNAYRQYSAPFSQKFNELKFSNNNNDEEWKKYAKTIWYGTLGLYDGKYGHWNPLGNTTLNDIYTKSNGKTVALNEYYSENDITSRRAKEILKLVNSGQLVYMDNSIFNGDDLSGTKLRKEFNSTDIKNRIKRINSDEMSASRIISDYSEKGENERRPIVNLLSAPEGDVPLDIDADDNVNYTKGDVSKRAMTFKFKVDNNNSNIKYKARLFLDYNADGIFKEEDTDLKGSECVAISDQPLEAGENTLTFNLDKKFVGFLDWKLEIVVLDENENLTDIKTNLFGSAIYKSITEEKEKYKILQIRSASNNNFLLTDKDFSDLLNKCSDYDFEVSVCTVSDFNSKKINASDYDMIIVGFADNFGSIIGNEFTDEGIKKIEDFIKGNKSIMFTHDTISLSVLGESEIAGKKYYASDLNLAYKLSKNFKDTVGQSRYYDIFTDSNTKIKHDELKTNKNSIGATAFSSVKLYNTTMTKKTRAVNKAQITSYPYNLNEYKDNNDRSYDLKISTTHTQWFQLNLEDEELVPWYNISGVNAEVSNQGDTRSIKYNNGDSRNFYYTYSVRNITYSGTGHSKIDSAEEKRLFVNTIYKAIRGANLPPTVDNYLEDKNTIIEDGRDIEVDCAKDYKYTIKVSDTDAKKGENFKVYSSGAVSNFNIQLKDGNDVIQNGVAEFKYNGKELVVECTIPSESLINHIGETVTIESYALDGYSDKSNIASFKINIIDNSPPTIIHGINKVEDSILNSDNYPNFNFKSWDSSNVGFNIDVTNDKYRPYMDVVPMAAYVNTYCSDTTLVLTMSDNFEVNDKESSFAYENKDTNKYISRPTVYVVDSGGNLVKLGTMNLVQNTKNKYQLDITKEQIIQYANEGHVNLMVEYYGKTYNHEMDNDQKMEYKNLIEVKKGDKTISQQFYFNVGYKPITEDLI